MDGFQPIDARPETEMTETDLFAGVRA